MPRKIFKYFRTTRRTISVTSLDSRNSVPLRYFLKGFKWLDSQRYHVDFYRGERTYTPNFTLFFLLHKSASRFQRKPQLNLINFQNKDISRYIHHFWNWSTHFRLRVSLDDIVKPFKNIVLCLGFMALKGIKVVFSLI